MLRRRATHAALAVTAATVLVLALVLMPPEADHINVPAAVGTLEELAVHEYAATILADADAVAALPAVVTDELQGLDGPPFVVATATFNGASRWCGRLAAEYHVEAGGDIRIVLFRPRWAPLLAGGCDQDVPAPAAVVVAVPAADLAAADELRVDFSIIHRGFVACTPSPPGATSPWSCDQYPGSPGD